MAWALRASTPVTTGSLNPIPSGGSTLALGAAVSAGDRIVVGVLTFRTGSGTQPAPTVTDNLNTGNYIEDASVTFIDGTVQVRASVCSMGNSAAGTPTIKLVSGTGSDQGGFSAMAFSGLSTANDGSGLDAHASGHSVFSGSIGSIGSGSTGATTAANELRVGYYADDGWNNGPLAGTGLTQDVVHGADVTSYEGLLEHQDSGASGSTSGVGLGSSSGINTNTPWAMLCAVYKLAGAGGGTTPSSSDTGTLTETAAGSAGLNTSAAQTLGEAAANALGTADPVTLSEGFTNAMVGMDAASVAEQVSVTVATAAQQNATFAEQVAIAIATGDTATLSDLASVNTGGGTPAAVDNAALAEAVAIASTTSATDQATLQQQLANALNMLEGAGLAQQMALALVLGDSASLAQSVAMATNVAAIQAITLGEAAFVDTGNRNIALTDQGTLGETAVIFVVPPPPSLVVLSDDAPVIGFAVGDFALMPLLVIGEDSLDLGGFDAGLFDEGVLDDDNTINLAPPLGNAFNDGNVPVLAGNFDDGLFDDGSFQ